MAFRFGLIGAGGAADLHAKAIALLPDVEVTAIADVDGARAAATANRYGIPAVFNSVEALLAGADVDAIDVLSPHHMHFAAARAAAECGKAVLIEKALAPCVKEAEAITEVCRKHRVPLGGILQYRFTPGGRLLRETVQRGALGRIFLASVTGKFRRSPEYYSLAPWRGRRTEAGGGLLTTQLIHTLDLLIYAMGLPRRVLGRTATAVHSIEVEDTATGWLEYAPECLAVIQGTTAAVPEQPPQIEICGERGTATTFDAQGEVFFWSSTLDEPGSLTKRWQTQTALYQGQESGSYNQTALKPHAENIADFVAAVRERRTPLIDGIEATKVLRLNEALYASAASGRWVEV